MRQKIKAFTSILSQKAKSFLATHGLDRKKTTLILLAIFTLAIPLSVLAVTTFTTFLPRASQPPVTPPTPPFPTPTPSILNPVHWTTPQVSLKADDFYLIADGQKFLNNLPRISIHSDPGNSTYTTLELIWQENNREMRLFMYFNANGTDWWSPEIRTYHAQNQYPDWIYYTGRFFESPLGQPFISDVNLTSDPGQQFSGRIYFKNLRLQTFLTQPTPTQTLTPTLAPPTLTPTPTPILVGCNQRCNPTIYPPVNCKPGLTCWVSSPTPKLGAWGVCRNRNCLQEKSCVCKWVTPTPTVRPTATPTRKLTPTPTRKPTPTPTIVRPRPTATPTRRLTPTTTPTLHYHTECRVRGFWRFKTYSCVPVPGPGVNQCRTSTDCRPR